MMAEGLLTEASHAALLLLGVESIAFILPSSFSYSCTPTP
jgi:hypothetical protein